MSQPFVPFTMATCLHVGVMSYNTTGSSPSGCCSGSVFTKILRIFLKSKNNSELQIFLFSE